MGFRRCNDSIGFEELLKCVSEYDILARYFNVNALPALINSPLRSDKNASMSIFSPDGNKILFKDFGSGWYGGIFDILGLIWHTSFNDTLGKIHNDMLGGQKGSGVYKAAKRRIIHRGNSSLDVKTRNWSEDDTAYWKSYGINRKWLEFGDVYPISHILFTRDGLTRAMAAEKLAYVYVERKDSNVSLKIYQPKSNHMKWLSKHDASVWDLWTKLPPEGKRLFVTSSRKDALCLWANTGIPSVSLQGEGYIPKRKVIDELKRRFEEVIIFFDNDFNADENHGHIYAERLCDMFDLPMVEIPSVYKSKDPSDLYRNYGSEVFRRVIKELLISLQTNKNQRTNEKKCNCDLEQHADEKGL